MTPSVHVGFVGLGRMGRPMAARLLAAGVPLAVFDERADVVDGLVRECGGTAAPSVDALGRASEIVITMLPDGGAVRRVVVDQDDRLLGAMPPGAVLIDMGSSSPAGTQALGQLLASNGVAMLDAPVSGGVARAVTGALSIMVGGEPAVVARCRPLLAHLGERVFETGMLGSGHALKALNNLVSAAGLLAATEALLIGRRFGLDPGLMVDVFNASTARNNSTEQKLHQFVLSRTFASGFALDLMAKDLGTALALADHVGVDASFGRRCLELWTEASRALGAGADHTEVARWLESVSGTALSTEER